MLSFMQITKGLNIKPSKGAFGYASVTLINDNDENILFDTGSYGVRSVIVDLLKKEKIDKVFISHLHFDHCSNLDLFKDSKIYINKKELESLYNNEQDLDIYKPLISFIDKYDVIAFDSNTKISDNVNIVLTPGHTLGHSSLEVDIDGKKVLIAGDAIKSLNDYLNDEEYGNAFDPETYKKTKKEIKEKYDIIIPGHSDIINKECLKNNPIELKIF